MAESDPVMIREELYQSYLQGLLTNNRVQCVAAFDRWLEFNPDLRSLYDDLLRRALYEVGELWEHGRITVATEHLATAISESLLPRIYPRLFARPRTGKSAVVTCVANEHHQIGSKIVADFFELHGWRGYFLGVNASLAEVLALIAAKQPNVVALSAATAMSWPALLEATHQVRAQFPQVPILVGGQIFRWGGREELERISGVLCLTALNELEKWIQEH